jgi:hypothetical protein
MINFTRIAVRTFTVVSFTLAVTQLWAASVSAAELRQPGRCYTVETLVTAKDGSSQHITRKTVCEYTAEERRAADRRTAGR